MNDNLLDVELQNEKIIDCSGLHDVYRSLGITKSFCRFCPNDGLVIVWDINIIQPLINLVMPIESLLGKQAMYTPPQVYHKTRITLQHGVTDEYIVRYSENTYKLMVSRDFALFLGEKILEKLVVLVERWKNTLAPGSQYYINGIPGFMSKFSTENLHTNRPCIPKMMIGVNGPFPSPWVLIGLMCFNPDFEFGIPTSPHIH